ncbi:MAG: thioredoxin domain-containing protein [Anaeromyxobacteraceae bacterium]
MNKNVSWVIALIVGFAGGYFVGHAPDGQRRAAAVRPGAQPPPGQRPARPQEDPNAIYRIPVDGSASKGPADALVTIVESSDFECPFCKRAAPTLKQVEEAYAGKVRMVFKHNPLPMHSNAVPAATAAEAAGAQGKFWPMHDKLFASASLDRAALEQAATELGLDLKGFRAALDGQRSADRIRRDQELVRGVGAGGTPTFFINGRKLVGAQPFERFKAVIDGELAKAQALVASGTPAAQVYEKIMSTASAQTVFLPGSAAEAGARPQQPSAPPPPPPQVFKKIDLRPDDPARGPATAKVTLVLFSDFQCPFCGKVEPTLSQLEQEAKGNLRIVWKHRPLPMHANARGAAAAAEAARAQGKFWPMHDKLFENQQSLSPETYDRLARELGLNAARFKAALADPKLAARIDADDKQAVEVGAGGTPTMYLNCRQVVGALPPERLRPILQEEIAKVDRLLAAGVKAGPALYAKACEENVKLAAAQPQAAPQAAPAPAGLQKIDLRSDDPVRGNKAAPVTIVLFSDFQCPYCSRVEPTLQQVLATYGNKVRVAWKHQPLPFHPNAGPAAEAAEAAREQGKFWEMHDALFQNQQSLSPETYERLARQIGLNVNAFKASIASGRNRARITEDQQLAGRIGANGTPTMFVNGEKVEGAVPFEMIKPAIDRALAKK